MKIGIDARMYRSSVAGIGRYSQNLIANLLKIDQNDEFVLFMTNEDYREFKNSKFEARLQASNPKIKVVIAEIPHYSLAEQTKFGKVIEKEKLDLMHFLNFNYPVNYKGKFIVTIHDLTLLFYPETAKETSFIKRTAFRHVMKKACQNSEKIIAVSESTKKDIVKAFKTSKEKIQVIHEAADDKVFQKCEIGTENKLLCGKPQSIPKGQVCIQAGFHSRSKLRGIQPVENKIRKQCSIDTKPVLLTVGQFRPHKNLPGLIEAFNILRKEIDCKLVILGKRDSKHQRFNNAYEKSEFKKDIILPGFVSDEELSCYYKMASVFVFPSLYEGFGLPGLEAMAAGTAVAASNTSSLPEIYEDAAIYFDPLKVEDIAAKIKEILGSEKLRQVLIEKGKIVAKKYSWKKTAEETLKVYEEVINK